MNVYVIVSEHVLGRVALRELALGLLDYALMQEFGVTQRPEILRTARGKPYFADSDIHFSYSHCDYAAACCVHSAPVGVDIQPLSAPKPAVIRRVCCGNEVMETPEDFTRAWVRKEAYSKFTGRGLAEGFNTIDTADERKFPPHNVFRHGEFFIAVYSADLRNFLTFGELRPVQVALL
jgi:phosphopantetheinyl transferase